MQAEVGRPPGDHQNPRGQAGKEEVERALASFFLQPLTPFLGMWQALSWTGSDEGYSVCEASSEKF